MKDRVFNAIEKYNRRFAGNDKFYGRDCTALMDKYNGPDQTFDLVANALKAGFIIGMRYQKAQEKKARKGKE